MAAAVLSVLAATVIAVSSEQPTNPRTLTILYTSRARSQIRSCNCTKFRYGGYGRQVFGETWISHYGGHQRESTRGWVVQGMGETIPMEIGIRIAVCAALAAFLLHKGRRRAGDDKGWLPGRR